MKFMLGVVAALALAPILPSQAAQYSTVTAADIESLLNGPDQDKSVATFYIAGVMDALSLQNSMLEEQGMPLFCPPEQEDLRAVTLGPKLAEHIGELRKRARSKDSLGSITAGTILTVMLSGEYPCEIDPQGGTLVPPTTAP